MGGALRQGSKVDRYMVTVGKDARSRGTHGATWNKIGDVSEAGDQVSVADLNKGIIIQSGNDAVSRLPTTSPERGSLYRPDEHMRNDWD